MEPPMRLELMTSALPKRRSATELRRRRVLADPVGSYWRQSWPLSDPWLAVGCFCYVPAKLAGILVNTSYSRQPKVVEAPGVEPGSFTETSADEYMLFPSFDLVTGNADEQA